MRGRRLLLSRCAVCEVAGALGIAGVDAAHVHVVVVKARGYRTG